MAERPVFYVDRCLGVRAIPSALRAAGAAVEIHDDHFAPDAEDAEWIPAVSANGWVILTKDQNIRRNRGEMEAVLLSRARIFTLTSGNMTGLAMAELFVRYLTELERIALSEPAPFIYAVGATGTRRLYPATAG